MNVLYALAASADWFDEFVSLSTLLVTMFLACLGTMFSKHASFRTCLWILNGVCCEDWFFSSISVGTCAGIFWNAVSGLVIDVSGLASTAWSHDWSPISASFA